MSPNPEFFLAHLSDHGYHPRSDKHSNALAEAIAADLVRSCPTIQERAAAGALVYDLNFDLVAGTATWNVDLVLGTPAGGTSLPMRSSHGITRQKPTTVQIAIEFKSVMTEHRKAVKNRKRDLEAHHEHVHNYSDTAIAGGVFVLNAASVFRSPLRQDNTTHKNPTGLVDHCVQELRSVASRGSRSNYGLEAKCAIVVDLDNRGSPVSFVDGRPAPRVGDPLHYDSFVQTICNLYTQRF